MSKINVLDKNTINQIAAGEVIERPASIVKELVENAIDAGASSITCEISGGGISMIRITDNGSGIDMDDVRTAFLRHATSKIKNAEDLTSITSLGFRGEALSSIAAVAELEVLTKTRASFIGIRYRISNGEEIGFEEIGCPDGTTFIVRNVFENIPARRKFLKSAVTEAGYITEIMERIGMSHPEVSVKYINNGKTVLFTSGNNNIKDVIYAIYGRETAASLIDIDYSDDNIEIKGYIAKPTIARGNRNLENYFVNGRFIKSQVIFKAIEEAYKGFLMQHKYPFTSLQINIEPKYMDVNVHPSKQEVRFENNEIIYKTVYRAIKEALSNMSHVRHVSVGRESEDISLKKAEQKLHEDKLKNLGKIPEVFEENRLKKFIDNKIERPEIGLNQKSEARLERKSENKVEVKTEVVSYKKTDNLHNDIKVTNSQNYTKELAKEPVNFVVEEALNYEKKETKKEEAKVFNEIEGKQLVFDTIEQSGRILEETKDHFEKSIRSGHRIIGQLFGTYWLVERGDEFYMIDQHAAHEKILYEKLVKQMNENTVTSQTLSPPVIISVSATEKVLVDQNLELFSELGFEISDFGGREYAITAVPEQLYGMSCKDFVQELISNMSDFSSKNKGNILKDKIATMACKAAVKGNTNLSASEAEALIEDLLALDNPFNCPHGRPVIIAMGKYDIEKKFKRIV